jgi:hypothetical protein
MRSRKWPRTAKKTNQRSAPGSSFFTSSSYDLGCAAPTGAALIGSGLAARLASPSCRVVVEPPLTPPGDIGAGNCEPRAPCFRTLRGQRSAHLGQPRRKEKTEGGRPSVQGRVSRLSRAASPRLLRPRFSDAAISRYRTSRQNDALTADQHAHIGSYALVGARQHRTPDRTRRCRSGCPLLCAARRQVARFQNGQSVHVSTVAVQVA